MPPKSTTIFTFTQPPTYNHHMPKPKTPKNTDLLLAEQINASITNLTPPKNPKGGNYKNLPKTRHKRNKQTHDLARANSFANAYLQTGGNAVKAVELLTKKGLFKATTYKTMSSTASVEIRRPHFRERLLHLLEKQGVNPNNLTAKIKEALDNIQLNPNLVSPEVYGHNIKLFNNCLSHLRAIIGLDAAKTTHHQSTSQTVAITGTLSELHDLALKAKQTYRNYGTPATAAPLPNALLTNQPIDIERIDTETKDHSTANSIPSAVHSIT